MLLRFTAEGEANYQEQQIMHLALILENENEFKK